MTPRPASISVPLTDSSLVGKARRIATELARKAAFDDVGEARVGVVVTEAASNALRHGEKAQILLRVLDDHFETGVEMIALDSGRGMADVARCLEDGYSTAGTLGNGLGAIRRLSDVFDIHSQVNGGTALLARFYQRSSRPKARMDLGCVCLPVATEQACGDGWTWQARAESELFLVADGLGHGPLAAKASEEAARVFQGNTKGHPSEILLEAHEPMRATRGASVAVAEVSFSKRTLRYAGVGNISGRILTGDESRSLISYNGTLGHEIHRIQEIDLPWPQGGLLVLHSDGLLGRWDLARYPGLAFRHPALVAGVLYRDFVRGRDDVTVLVVRERI